MPRAHDAALEKRESRFHGVRMHVAVCVLPRMIDGLVKVLLHLVKRPRVDRGFIRHNHFYMAPDIGVDYLAHGRGLRILGANHSQIAIALSDTDYDLFVRTRTPAALLTANISFVNLDNTPKLLFGGFQHGRSDAMAEVPRRFIADLELALHLIRRHTLARLTKQVGRKKPLPQRQVGIVEDRSRCRAKLIAASIAVKLVTFDNARNLVRLARGTGNAFRPAKLFDVGAALGFVAKVFDQGTEVQFAH